MKTDVEKIAAAQMSDLLMEWGDIEHDSDLAITSGHLELVMGMAERLGLDKCIECIEYDLSMAKSFYEKVKEVSDIRPKVTFRTYENGKFDNTEFYYPEGFSAESEHNELLKKLGYKIILESGNVDGPTYVTIEHTHLDSLWPFLATFELNNTLHSSLCKTYRESLEFINLHGTIAQLANSNEINDMLNRIKNLLNIGGET